MIKKEFLLLFALGLSACAPPQGPVSKPLGSTQSSRPAVVKPAPINIDIPQPGADEGYTDIRATSHITEEAVASLGSPSVPGLWIRGPFIEEGSEVEVYATDTGKAVLVTAGPDSDIVQMSLASFQALGVSPAELIPVEIRTP